MEELKREVYLGRVSRGKADFKVTLIIEWNDDYYPGSGNVVRLYVRYAGREYQMLEKARWFVGDLIRPENDTIKDIIPSLYILHEIYLSPRAFFYDGNLLISVVWKELEEKKRYGAEEFDAVIKEINGGVPVEAARHVPDEVPESTLRWLFSLPGTGATWDDIQASTSISEEEFMNIISTTG